MLKGIEKLGHSKLTSIFQQVIKSDPVSKRGLRKFNLGDYALVEGLELGWDKISDILGGLPKVEFVIESNQVRFDFHNLGKISLSKIPSGSSHFEIRVFVIKVNEGEQIEGSCSTHAYSIESLDQELFQLETVEIGLGTKEVGGETHLGEEPETIIVAIGVRFFQFVNGEFYKLNEGGGVCLVRVFAPPRPAPSEEGVVED